MTADEFFLVEVFTTTKTAATPTATAEQGTLFDMSTYAGPENSRGVSNVAMLDAFGELAV